VSFGDFWFLEWGLVYYLPVAEGPVEVAELDALVDVVEEAHGESTVRGDGVDVVRGIRGQVSIYILASRGDSHLIPSCHHQHVTVSQIFVICSIL
jgi:hypothetical protein